MDVKRPIDRMLDGTELLHLADALEAAKELPYTPDDWTARRLQWSLQHIAAEFIRRELTHIKWWYEETCSVAVSDIVYGIAQDRGWASGPIESGAPTVTDDDFRRVLTTPMPLIEFIEPMLAQLGVEPEGGVMKRTLDVARDRVANEASA